jgi:L-ascorbate metabolism protein UlaG (beta-lactamase superfamily)
LYRPNIGLIHVCNPARHMARHKMPIFLNGEMSPYEAALAAQWLGLEYAIAMHFDTTPEEPDVHTFVDLLNKATGNDARPKPVVLNFGETFEYEGKQ